MSHNVVSAGASEVDGAVAGRGWSYRPPGAPAGFPRTTWGHRGYDEASVDVFAQQMARDLATATDQIADLRTEVDRLHRYIRRQWAAVAAAEAASDRSAGRPAATGTLASPAAQARAVLSQAQEIADQRLAQAAQRLAEADRLADDRLLAAGRLADDRLRAADQQVRARLVDSNRLLLLARARYEDIVVRAHQRADRAAELALDEFESQNGRRAADRDDVGRAQAELEVKAAYLRTFAKVSRVALRAALDVTAREFDRLLGASASSELEAEALAAVADQEPLRVMTPIG